MEIPLRTAYSQAGRYGMQPKARQSSRAGAAKTRTETCEIVEEKQKLLDIREKEERERSELSDTSDEDNAANKTYESRILEKESSSDESNEETHGNI
ncbi:hypothetical protein TNCV_2540941 [Trichonephila clavipes]|nr:hypothetical protein TNCV_2540941 [Trichonephila clavipes]